MKRLIPLLLVLTLLCGCGGATNSLGFSGVVKFDDMTYTHPDMAELQRIGRESCDAALEGKDIDTVIDGVWAVYDAYDAFYTNYNLAYIHYNADLNDIYWQGEYEYCAENSADVDAMLDELYYALADSPLREELERDEYFGPGYFDYYDGESLYDETFLDLLEQEQALIAEYYELSAQTQGTEYYSDAYFDLCAEPLAQVLADLIGVRQEQAAWAGYDSYQEFCYDFYYYRDYTWADADDYLGRIRAELVDLYRAVNQSDVWDTCADYSSEKETFQYVQTVAENMGGVVEDAFRLLDEAELYDISYSETKSDISFEVFLYTYYEPYVFLNATETGYDKLTFAHEFGHFANDYASAGSYAGTDVLEVFSQGMEYLSLCYGRDTEELAKLKMADSLCTYVEQAAYAAFEHQMYELEDPTTAELFELYEETARAYGFDSMDWDPRDMVTVPHFFAQPLYIISYVVSNDAAMQLYQMEQAEAGSGLECFVDNLTTEESYFLSFLDSAGLEDPFEPQRLTDVRALMEDMFGA